MEQADRMINRAGVGDIEHIKRIGERFYNSSVWKDVIAYDPEYFGEFIANMIQSGGVVFISPHGFCGGMMAPVYFSPTARIAAELFWFSEDQYGPQLHQAFEDWARSEGAEIVQMTGQINDREKGIRRLYSQRGYAAKEIGFFKVI